MALLSHRDFVTPDDIKAVARGVLSHRLIAHEPSSEISQGVVDSILKSIPVPV